MVLVINCRCAIHKMMIEYNSDAMSVALHSLSAAPTFVGLVTKLVAGEADGREALVAVLLHQIIHGGEVVDGRASQGRDVLDEHDLALVVRELLLLALQGGRREVGKGRGHAHAGAAHADATRAHEGRGTGEK